MSLRPSFSCERSTTTLSPSIWHHDVSTHDWGKVSTAGGLYYYIESQYLTHEVSTHPWGQVSTAKGQYNYIVSKYLTHDFSTHHWDQGSTARGQYYDIESQYLTPWCQYTWLRQSFYCWRSVLLHMVPVSDNKVSTYSKGQVLLLEVSITALSQNIWHLKSVHITEAKYLLLGDSATTLSPCISHNDVSTHHWDQGSTSRGQF